MSEELQSAFWDAIKSDGTLLLGTHDGRRSNLRPMTAQIDAELGQTIYFFASRDEGIGADLNGGRGSVTLAFSSKGHDLFATGDGVVVEENDPAIIDKLWSAGSALFYENGRDDPKLILLKLEHADLQLWRSTTGGFVKAIAYKLMGKDAGDADSGTRGSISI